MEPDDGLLRDVSLADFELDVLLHASDPMTSGHWDFLDSPGLVQSSSPSTHTLSPALSPLSTSDVPPAAAAASLPLIPVTDPSFSDATLDPYFHAAMESHHTSPSAAAPPHKPAKVAGVPGVLVFDARSQAKTPAEQRDFKRTKRLIRNRESAKLSRQRKKQYIDKLEGEASRLREENRALVQEVRTLRARVVHLEARERERERERERPNGGGETSAERVKRAGAGVVALAIVCCTLLFVLPGGFHATTFLDGEPRLLERSGGRMLLEAPLISTSSALVAHNSEELRELRALPAPPLEGTEPTTEDVVVPMLVAVSREDTVGPVNATFVPVEGVSPRWLAADNLRLVLPYSSFLSSVPGSMGIGGDGEGLVEISCRVLNVTKHGSGG